jgi:type 1 glutamine amidotransferase
MTKSLVLLLSFLAGSFVHAAETAANSKPKVLVYTHNGPTLDGKPGYVHDNIAESLKAIEKIGAANGFGVVHADDPAIFTNASLKNFRAIIFANSNNKSFATEDERKAFQDYIRNGGGFVGIHSASGSERDSRWFWSLLGGTFAWHPPLQKFQIKIEDKNHPATAPFPGETWEWEDEFYVIKEQPKDLHVLLTGNIKPLRGVGSKADGLPDRLPLAWYHTFEGARSFYTALGHKKEYYSDPMFVKHLTGGILWAAKLDK